MYKIRERKRKLRVNNPAAFGILCAMLLVVGIGCLYGLAAGVVIPGVQSLRAANATPSPSPAPTVEAALITAAPVLTNTPEPSADPGADPEADPEAADTPAPESGSGKLSGKVIGLDPARGQDSKYKGIATKVYANRLNMAVALAAKSALEAEGAKVVMTYTDILKKPTADERALALNNGSVDAALRIECNYLEDTATRGAQYWIPSAHSDNQASCEKLGKAVFEAYLAATDLPSRKVGGSVMKQRDDMDIFNKTKAPIALLLIGHISNDAEDRLLNDEAFQTRMAKGIVDGFINYFG